MPTLLELTAAIVSAHVSNQQMSSDEMLQELQKVYAQLHALESGSPIVIATSPPTEAPRLSIKQAFKKDQVICMVCGKGGFKTLKRHIGQAHDLKPGQYRKQFGIPSTISLTAKSYSEARRQTALDNNLADGLAKARAKKAADKAPVPMKRAKAPVPAVKVKAPVPMKREKATVPAVRVKAAVPSKIEVATTAPLKAKKAPVKATKKK
jgi:predicted transcriptional regulator